METTKKYTATDVYKYMKVGKRTKTETIKQLQKVMEYIPEFDENRTSNEHEIAVLINQLIGDLKNDKTRY